MSSRKEIPAKEQLALIEQQKNVEETLILVKPDGVAKGLVGEILSELDRHGLVVTDATCYTLSTEQVEAFYAGEEEEYYFGDVVSHLTSGPVVLLRISGPNAIAAVKWEIVGEYPNGLRGRHSEDEIRNVAHSADSPEAAQRELALAQVISEEKRGKRANQFREKTVLVLTGMSESGKSTVGKHLDTQGIPRLKIRELFERVRDEQQPGMNLDDFVSQERRKNPFALWEAFIDQLAAEIEKRQVKMVSIESLYGGGLGPYLQRQLGDHFCLIYLEAPLETRLRYQMVREGFTNLEEARAKLLPRDKIKTESGIPELKEIADVIINNTGTIEDLEKQIDQIVSQYRAKEEINGDTKQ